MLDKGTVILSSLLLTLLLCVFIIEPMRGDGGSTIPKEQAVTAVIKAEPKLEVPAEEEVIEQNELQVFTEKTLSLYNGEDTSLPIYLAFEGLVYDVTSGKEFYGADGPYHFLAGTDGTKLLQLIGGDIIKRKYAVIGTYSK
jgi:predicted heme/steroid binding protein